MKIADNDLKKIISELTGASSDSIRDETEFVNDLRMDSLKIIELIAVLTEEYGMKINEEDAMKFHTYKNLYDYAQAVG